MRLLGKEKKEDKKGAAKRDEPQGKTALGDRACQTYMLGSKRRKSPRKRQKKAARKREKPLCMLACFIKGSHWMLFFVYPVSEVGSVCLLSLLSLLSSYFQTCHPKNLSGANKQAANEESTLLGEKQKRKEDTMMMNQ